VKLQLCESAKHLFALASQRRAQLRIPNRVLQETTDPDFQQLEQFTGRSDEFHRRPPPWMLKGPAGRWDFTRPEVCHCTACFSVRAA
jgi:hypothetical protein